MKNKEYVWESTLSLLTTNRSFKASDIKKLQKDKPEFSDEGINVHATRYRALKNMENRWWITRKENGKIWYAGPRGLRYQISVDVADYVFTTQSEKIKPNDVLVDLGLESYLDRFYSAQEKTVARYILLTGIEEIFEEMSQKGYLEKEGQKWKIKESLPKLRNEIERLKRENNALKKEVMELVDEKEKYRNNWIELSKKAYGVFEEVAPKLRDEEMISDMTRTLREAGFTRSPGEYRESHLEDIDFDPEEFDIEDMD